MERVRRLSRTFSDVGVRSSSRSDFTAQVVSNTFTNVHGKTHNIHEFKNLTVYKDGKILNLVTQPQLIISTTKSISLWISGRYIYINANDDVPLKMKKRSIFFTNNINRYRVKFNDEKDYVTIKSILLA